MKNYKLRELVDLHILQKIINDMYRMTGIVGSIVDMDETLVSTFGNQSACMKFHRCNPESFAHCEESDKTLIRQIQRTKKPVIRKCANGLIDAAYPIYIDNEFYGAIMSGQVFNKKPDMNFFREMAVRYHYDMDDYLKTIEGVPVIPEDHFQAAVDFYGQLSEVVAKLSIARLKEMEEKNILENEVELRTKELSEINVKLKNEILRAGQLTLEVSENEEKYRTLFESSSDGIVIFDLENTRILDMNSSAEKIFGYTRTEICRKKTISEFIEEFTGMPALLSEEPARNIPLVWFKERDGSFIPLEITVGLLSIHGEKHGFAIMRDISETINNNQKQTQLIQKMQSIFEEVKNFTDFVSTDVNALGPKKYLSDYGITRQEDKVVYYILQGYRNKEIGEKLFLSEETIRKHVHSILKKLNLKNRVELVHMIKNKNIRISFNEKI